MARYAVIDNGIVTNVIICDEEFASQAALNHDILLNVDGVSPAPSIGHTYNGSVFSAPAKTISDITPLQLRRALGRDNISSINEAIASMSEPERSDAESEWEYATSFSRSNPLVGVMVMTLGWTEEQLDELWIAASEI